ncbi:hypothetical protein [Methylobacterium sp. J-067]|uniref:hypothetical protein n=1 Tax=Methylobacterium sp. J-067 TaxID=2836648 RepID=UPI001FB9237E|nr:hypothetical protein [Methylobacterium sp. J-067]MCJ2023950.1 hypothetical protein [Methylobacterium sp. J-067]
MSDNIPESPETPEAYAARIADALREHERADKGLLAMFPATMAFAVEALKAPALINGGAAAAMLAFIGTGRQPITNGAILGMRIFGLGLLTAGVATGASWISQHYFLRAWDEGVRSYQRPFFASDKKCVRRANIFRFFAVALAFTAYGCAAAGMWTVSSSFMPASVSEAPKPTAPAVAPSGTSPLK